MGRGREKKTEEEQRGEEE
jgi:hypothetical protein